VDTASKNHLDPLKKSLKSQSQRKINHSGAQTP
jgi:hypothetical protein